MSSPTTPSSPKIEFRIRPAKLSELPTLVDMQQKMCIETENRELKTNVITRGLQRAFEVPEFGGSVYVAEPIIEDENNNNNNGEIAAMMMNTCEWDHHRNGMIIWFQSVYVDPKYRRRGIFRNFFAFVKQKVQNDPFCCSIRLDVDCTNENAQSTYKAQQMYLEGVRIGRYTKPGVEPADLSEEGDNKKEEEGEQEISSPLPPLNPAIRVRKITEKDIQLNPALFEQIVQMQFESSSIYYPTSFPTEGEKKKTLEMTKQGLLAIFDSSPSSPKIGAELYVAQLMQSNQCINIGSVVLTFEWSDWRDGLVLNAFGSFAVNPQYAKTHRRDCFRSFYRTFKQRSLSDPDVSGFRFNYEEAVESKLEEDSPERIDKAMVEEGMFIERYYLMRFDK